MEPIDKNKHQIENRKQPSRQEPDSSTRYHVSIFTCGHLLFLHRLPLVLLILFLVCSLHLVGDLLAATRRHPGGACVSILNLFLPFFVSVVDHGDCSAFYESSHDEDESGRQPDIHSLQKARMSFFPVLKWTWICQIRLACKFSTPSRQPNSTANAGFGW